MFVCVIYKVYITYSTHKEGIINNLQLVVVVMVRAKTIAATQINAM